LFKSVFTVGFYTLISRILGFIRDIFIASYLGSTLVADAFFVAFRIPNYFRRVFAEGAFSAAFIPVLSGIKNKSKNDKDIISFVELTMSLLFFVIIAITILFYFIMPYVIAVLAPGFLKNKETYDLAVHFGKIIFPYLLFIALVAQFSSITNTYNRFAFGAFAPALLNISFIGSLMFLTPYVVSSGHALSYGVLIGGVMQLLLMYYAIYKLQITPILVLPKIDDNVKKFLRLLLPGILGAGAIQLNIIVGTIIASFLPTGAISHLYYADRINQLPLALFGIALGIALLPTLSKYIKQGAGEEKINNVQNRSMEFSLLISLPSAAGLFILSEPIIRILFERGSFSSVDTYYSSQVLSLFALGLPAYILIKVLNPSFFAREDTKTPFYITLICVALNVLLSLLLIGSMREMGIALATAISSWVNALILYTLLKKKWQLSLDIRLKTNFIKILIATFLTFFGILLFRNLFLTDISNSSTSINALLLLLNILFALIIFASMVFVLKIYSKGEIKENLKI
tara:strand:+ start:295 stop:1839 length:1545 start_codon:yes stop_codon:yes gene_type:complete